MAYEDREPRRIGLGNRIGTSAGGAQQDQDLSSRFRPVDPEGDWGGLEAIVPWSDAPGSLADLERTIAAAEGRDPRMDQKDLNEKKSTTPKEGNRNPKQFSRLEDISQKEKNADRTQKEVETQERLKGLGWQH